MKICSLSIENYRTIESLKLTFLSSYAAVSGKNNSGKTNVVKMIRSFFDETEPSPFVDEPTITPKSDFPNWKTVDEGAQNIEFQIDLLVHSEFDAGLYRFITTFLALNNAPQELRMSLVQKWSKGAKRPALRLGCEGNQIADEFKIEEVFKKSDQVSAYFFITLLSKGIVTFTVVSLPGCSAGYRLTKPKHSKRRMKKC
jgi:AAA15 family ATPase/GTPase